MKFMSLKSDLPYIQKHLALQLQSISFNADQAGLDIEIILKRTHF